MTKLALNDVQRNALAGHLNGVGVSQPVWGEASTHAGFLSDAP